MRGYFIKNIGQNRGKPRIWLQDLEVSSAGLAPGDRYSVHVNGGSVVLRASPDGTRVVSSKTKNDKTLPVIDLNSQELLALFDGMAAVRLVQREGEIYILPLATELRIKERLNRLTHKIKSNQPLDVGSLSHGGGLLAHALHEGFAQAGIATTNRMANDIRSDLLEHAAHTSGTWTNQTLTVAAPMQELAFDTAARRHIPRLDVAEAGIPCSGASVAGRAKRGTALPEDHPEVGHLVVAALVILAQANPAVIEIENVAPYASSASASILRNQLRDLGYVTHETVLRGEDFNALENRDRWCMVAVTRGMHFDWGMLQKPRKEQRTLAEVLDEIPEDDPMWSEMAGLKAKEARDLAAGKLFKMQVFTPEDSRIGTITKGYAKVRSTDPKIRHPSDPNLLRQLTPAEHARLKQYPPKIIEGLSATIANEMLGQGVLRAPFVAANRLCAQSILDFVNEVQPRNSAELAETIAAEMLDTAGLVVSELRKPLAGVVYEGAITVNDLGMAVQDIGNGVGILHKSATLEHVRLGEILRVQYPSVRSAPKVTHLSQPAPAISEPLRQAMAEHALHQAQLDFADQAPSADGPSASRTISPRMN